MTVHVFDFADTWNASGTAFKAIRMNASNGSGGAAVGSAASRLLELLDNGSEAFGVDIRGRIIAGGQNNSSVMIGSGHGANSGGANLAIGISALGAVSSGVAHVAVGNNALANITTASYCTAVGYRALESCTGQYNNGFGQTVMLALTSGTSNNGFGHFALGALQTGQSNAAFGQYALRNATASYNSAFGTEALNDVTSGNYNTGLGQRCGLGLQTGDNNTILGARIGDAAAGNTALASGLTGAIIIAPGDGVIKADYGNTAASVWSFAGPDWRLHNTVLGSANPEYFQVSWASNICTVGTTKGGSGTDRQLNVRAGATGGANLLLQSFAVGFGTSSSNFAWLVPRSNGVMTLQNNGLTDWDRLQFGGTTSSFPALKRSTTVLQARLADDSAFAPLQGRLRAEANAVAETPTATHTLLLQDAAGTQYKVLAVAA